MVSEQPFSNEVAVRIGLAAAHLPTIGVADLIRALQHYLGDDLTEEKLGRITVTQLKSAFRQSHDVDGDDTEDREDFQTAEMSAFKEAVSILWGEPEELVDAPTVDPIDESASATTSITVAIASNHGERLDGHFGSCACYLVYRVSAEAIRLVDVRSSSGADASGDRNGFRADLIRDCAILCVVSIGGPAAAKVVKRGIHIMAISEGGEARKVAQKIQGVLTGAPPPWLRKALAASSGSEGVANSPSRG